jgi:hypothetical protein
LGANGWQICNPEDLDNDQWNPLANPADLLDVIGAMRERGFDLTAEVEEFTAEARFARSLDRNEYRTGNREVRGGDWRAAVAEAVCRAALEAVKL